jgi:3-oxoacyl-[acyl-carrier-protein] synthase III
MSGSQIVGLGHYQPTKVLTNDDLAKLVDTNDEWIRSRVGIRTRHIADTETVDEMAAYAAEKALARCISPPARATPHAPPPPGLTAQDIDLITVATCTAADRSPNMAGRVAGRLGLTTPATYDINTACSGFCYALATADHAIRAGAARSALVIASEKLSAFTDWTDRSTCVLVGDGAGAAVVTAAEQPRIGPVVWGSVPELSDAVRIEGDPAYFSQSGQAVFRWATTALAGLMRETCVRAGVEPEELGAFVPHQANLRIIEPLAKQLGAKNAIVARDVVESGNTSAASVPLALSKLVERGEIPSGAPVLLFGFGGGLAYAGQVVRCP